MKRFGYKQTQVDHTLFVKNSTREGNYFYKLCNNIILTTNGNEKMQRLEKYLATEFEIKDLGHLKSFLGNEVASLRHGIFLTQ